MYMLLTLVELQNATSKVYFIDRSSILVISKILYHCLKRDNMLSTTVIGVNKCFTFLVLCWFCILNRTTYAITKNFAVQSEQIYTNSETQRITFTPYIHAFSVQSEQDKANGNTSWLSFMKKDLINLVNTRN